MIIPVFIPVTEEEMDAMSIDIMDLPSWKQVVMFLVTLIPVWAVVVYLWAEFVAIEPFFTDHLLFLNLSFSITAAAIVNLFIWFMVDEFVINWINKLYSKYYHFRKRRKK